MLWVARKRDVYSCRDRSAKALFWIKKLQSTLRTAIYIFSHEVITSFRQSINLLIIISMIWTKIKQQLTYEFEINPQTLNSAIIHLQI